MTIKLRQATVTREFDNWQRANNYGPYQMRARELGLGPNIIEPGVQVSPVTAEEAVSEALDYFTDQIDGRTEESEPGEQAEINRLHSLRDGLQIAKEALS